MHSGFPIVITVFISLFFAIWTGIALFMVIAPYTFWKITQSWKSFKEPPKIYFVFQRIGGIICSVIGLSFWLFAWWRLL
jgi:hypothetical protein